jgi:hypothetical protein
MHLGVTWGGIRAVIRGNFSFSGIKDICGTAGLPVRRLAHLQQKLSGGASKGQPMDAIDGLITELGRDDRDRFVESCVQEALRHKPECLEALQAILNRGGWAVNDDGIHPLVAASNCLSQE